MSGPGSRRPAPPAAKQHAPINNPSYHSNPELWHAVAMQQQRMSELGLPTGLKPRGAAARSGSRDASGRVPRTGAAGSGSGRGDGDSDDEYDLDAQYTPTLTLAQRMGLVEAPEPELTPSEWEAIAEQSRRRDESRQPCVICQEDFKDEKQVLLSCGHTFHRQCLRSWERHSKSRSCPVCRKLHYRKRTIDDGANIYRDECATRVQTAWRGHATRRVTAKTLRSLNPERRRRYCESRLGGLTDALIGRIDAERSEVGGPHFLCFGRRALRVLVTARRSLTGGGACAVLRWMSCSPRSTRRSRCRVS
jgi:hypothetical protein